MIVINGVVYYDDLDLNFVSRRTLQRWRKAGKLPFIKLGSRVLYRPADVNAMLVPQAGTAGRTDLAPAGA